MLIVLSDISCYMLVFTLVACSAGNLSRIWLRSVTGLQNARIELLVWPLLESSVGGILMAAMC